MRPVEPRRTPWIARSGARFSTGVLALAALIALPTSSCKRKDPEKCQQGMTVARQAMASEDFALAKQWREYAWKNCEDQTGLATLDQELANKEAEVTRRKSDEATKGA